MRVSVSSLSLEEVFALVEDRSMASLPTAIPSPIPLGCSFNWDGILSLGEEIVITSVEDSFKDDLEREEMIESCCEGDWLCNATSSSTPSSFELEEGGMSRVVDRCECGV